MTTNKELVEKFKRWQFQAQPIQQEYFAEQCATIAEEEIIKVLEWVGDEDNPFIMVKGKWMQAAGNSTSWTTNQLLSEYFKQLNG